MKNYKYKCPSCGNNKVYNSYELFKIAKSKSQLCFACYKKKWYSSMQPTTSGCIEETYSNQEIIIDNNI